MKTISITLPIKNKLKKFTFEVIYLKDGWHAKCLEYDGIITGGSKNNPSDDDIIEMMKDSIKTAFNIDVETWLIAADFHWKYVDKVTLEKLHKVAREIKPDVLCSLGDEVDYDGISKFTLKKYGDGIDECEEELKSFKKGWEELVKSCGNPKQIMCLGNHNGERVEKMLYKLESKKMNREAKDVRRSLDFKLNFPEVKIVPYNSFIKKNGLILTHGEFHNENHPKTHALRYNCDVVYGHMHSLNAYSLAQKGSGKVKKAISLPCMCNTNPRYRGNKSSAWTNGFAVITFHDATYSIEIVEVKNNKAVFRGKII